MLFCNKLSASLSHEAGNAFSVLSSWYLPPACSVTRRLVQSQAGVVAHRVQVSKTSSSGVVKPQCCTLDANKVVQMAVVLVQLRHCAPDLWIGLGA